MTDDEKTKDAPPPLESIEGRARIVDAAGNPIDPDNPPWAGEQTETRPTKAEAKPEADAKPEEHESEDDDDDDDDDKHEVEVTRARTVRRRHTRSSE